MESEKYRGLSCWWRWRTACMLRRSGPVYNSVSLKACHRDRSPGHSGFAYKLLLLLVWVDQVISERIVLLCVSQSVRLGNPVSEQYDKYTKWNAQHEPLGSEANNKIGGGGSGTGPVARTCSCCNINVQILHCDRRGVPINIPNIPWTFWNLHSRHSFFLWLYLPICLGHPWERAFNRHVCLHRNHEWRHR